MASTVNTSTRNVVDMSDVCHRHNRHHHRQPARHSDPIVVHGGGVPESVMESCGRSVSSMVSALTLDRDLEESFSTLGGSRRFAPHLCNGSQHKEMCSKPERNNSVSSSVLKAASSRLVSSMDLEGNDEFGSCCHDDDDDAGTDDYEMALSGSGDAPAAVPVLPPDNSSLRFSTHSCNSRRHQVFPGKPMRRSSDGTIPGAATSFAASSSSSGGDEFDFSSDTHRMNTSFSLEACLSAPLDGSDHSKQKHHPHHRPHKPFRRQSRRSQFRLSGGSHAPNMTIDPSTFSSLGSSLTLDSALFDTSTSGSSLSLAGGSKRFCDLPYSRNLLSPLTKPIRHESSESSKSNHSTGNLTNGSGHGTPSCSSSHSNSNSQQGECVVTAAPPSMPNRRQSLMFQIQEAGDSTDEEQSR